MKLSMPLNYAGDFAESTRRVVELESAGLDVVWVAEAYGYDGPSLMGSLLFTLRITLAALAGAALLPAQALPLKNAAPAPALKLPPRKAGKIPSRTPRCF